MSDIQMIPNLDRSQPAPAFLAGRQACGIFAVSRDHTVLPRLIHSSDDATIDATRLRLRSQTSEQELRV